MPPVLSKNKKIMLAVSVLLLDEKIRDKKRRPKLWMKNLYRTRRRFTHVNLLRELDVDDFRNYLRMDEDCFRELLALVKPHIEKKNTKFRECVNSEERLIATLRYLATGRTYQDMKFSAIFSPQLMSTVIPETCAAIYYCLKKYIKLPSSEEEWRTVAQDFDTKWNFSHALGSLDGKHVAIKKPADSGSLYFNYKKFFSVIFFAIVNANYEFMYVHVGTNGSVSDATVLQNTKFYDKLITNKLNVPAPSPLPGTNTSVPYVFLGDSAFGLNSHIMKPYPFKKLSHDERIFNYRLSRARRVVENSFGILSSRFRIFQQAISINVENVSLVVLACCALHNFLSKKNLRYLTQNSVDTEDTNEMQIRPGEWREMSPLVSVSPSDSRQGYQEGKVVRQKFTSYFNGEGAVPFQEDMCTVSFN